MNMSISDFWLHAAASNVMAAVMQHCLMNFIEYDVRVCKDNIYKCKTKNYLSGWRILVFSVNLCVLCNFYGRDKRVFRK